MNSPRQTITVKIGGEAGFGIMTTGLMLSKVVARSGFSIFDYVEYPSLIRGGHNVYEVRFGSQEVFSQESKVDLLVALNKETFFLHKDELKEQSGVLFDNETVAFDASEIDSKKIVLLPVPFGKIIKEAAILPVTQNNIALGALCALLGFKLEILLQLIKDTFIDKGEKIILDNQKAAQLGFNYVSSYLKGKFVRRVGESNPSFVKKLVITGNDAIALGAVAVGCSFYASYPMTPSSSVLHTLAGWSEKVKMVVKHAEDEIAAINMAIGASFAGVRAMCGTSGGGFSLMTEGLGLAGLTETPLVILEAQRPGPATGMPTWTEQADLKFLINASQGEFPRIILAPGDPEEAFYLTVEAFNLADIYQTPVFILSDKYLSESHKSVDLFNLEKVVIERGKLLSDLTQYAGEYKRYQITDDGISPRLIPGTKGGYFIANSYEHEENSLSTEDKLERAKQVDKRNKKFRTYINRMPSPSIYGDDSAEVTLVGWGSTKGPVLQALSDLDFTYGGKKINFLHLNHVWPLDKKTIDHVLTKAGKKIMVEGNSTGQMASLIRQETGIMLDDMLLKYDGRPFYPEEIINKLEQIL